MPYKNQKFCWFGIISTDVDRAKAFYTEALGWSTMTMTMEGSEATMFVAGGVPIAHLSAPVMPGIPSHWENYFRVKDVDAATKAAKEHGGDVAFPPTDIPPGRFSVVTSPSGAALSLFHEADPSSENAPEGEGSICWTELHSTDMEADLKWLSAALGVESESTPMPDGDYFMLKGESGPAGGAMSQRVDGAPAHWLSWVAVADVDATLERVTRHGGKGLTPIFEADKVGRMAVVADPTGGAFGIITLAKHD